MYLSKGRTPVSKAVREALRTSTVRSFEGGLNVADTDLNMSPKYARVLDNLERNLDGTLSVRPGTRLRAVVAPGGDATDIVNCTYFAGYVISVQKSGMVTRTDGAGNVTALPLVAGVTRWTANSFTNVNFTIFNSNLIMVNGVQKPYIVGGRADAPNYLTQDLLHDLGSLANTNTPISKFVATHGRYVIHGFLPAAPGNSPPFNTRSRPSTIVISSRDTSGTYPGDGAPNDAVEIDLGPRVSLGDAAITGLVSYRDKLIVTFERGVLPMTLGIYTTTGTQQVHTPSDDGFIGESGCLTHRSLTNVGDDTYFCDNIGVDTLSRVSLLNTLRPHRVSYLVDVLITRALTALSSAQIQQFVFAVYDLRNSRYMLFIPVFAADGTTITETVCFSYTNIPQLSVTAWARLRGWVWQAACRTELKNIIFARENKLYSYEFDDVIDNADLMGDPTANPDLSGVAVNFDWELPWADFDRRLNSKTIKYLHTDTQGTGGFTAMAYADNVRTDDTGLIDQPLLSIDFDGADTLGYGRAGWGASYGGGGTTNRPTNEERLYGFPMKCNLMKLRFNGATKLPLRFVSISVLYERGSIRRA